MFIVLLLNSGVLTFNNAEHKAVLQAIGQADGSDSQMQVRLAVEAILGAPSGSLNKHRAILAIFRASDLATLSAALLAPTSPAMGVAFLRS